MARPARVDQWKKVTLALSGVCREQLPDLVEVIACDPGRRTKPSYSEVVEIAVAKLHSDRVKTKGKRS